MKTIIFSFGIKRFNIFFFVISSILLFAFSQKLPSQENLVNGYWKFFNVKEVKNDFYLEEQFKESKMHTSYEPPYSYFYYHVKTNGLGKNKEKIDIKDYKMTVRTQWKNMPDYMIPGNKYSIIIETEVIEAENPSESGGPAPGYQIYLLETKKSQVSIADLKLTMPYSPPNAEFDYSYLFTIGVYKDHIQGNVNKSKEDFYEHIKYTDLLTKFRYTAEINLSPPTYIENNSEYGILLIFGDVHRGYNYFIFTYKWTPGSPGENNKPEYAIKSTPSPKELKPDGVSASEIEAVLYEYIPGDPNSSKPLSNKKVTFRIEQQSGIIPGTLSTYEAYTDAYGRANVIYTAPDANSINNQNIITATVVARCDEYNAEDIAYLSFRFEKGNVTVEPNMKGVVSNYGIVPPDKRYPAKISASLEDDGGHKKANTGVTFSLSGNKTYGLLRTSTGQTGTSVSVTSDADGFAEVEYFYNSDTPPGNDAMETVDIKSDGMSRTLNAYIYIGLNLVIESAVSGYEGKGIINAGEEIPVKIKLKDLRYPDLDLSKVISYWSNPMLKVKLDIKPQGSVPGYLLDKLKLENYPQPEFSEIVSLKSFEDKNEFNYLWVSEYSLLNYQGFPKIKPTITGQTNYVIDVSLVDDNGQPLVINDSKNAVISIETGLPADAFSIFFIENPFGPHTDQAMFFRTVLDLAGYGLLLNIADAASAINKGNVTDLVGTVLSALKDVMLDKAKLNSDLIKTYTELAYTEKIASLALGELLIAKIENALISKIASLSTWGDKILIVLNGNGSQRLLDAKTNSPVPVQENSITADDNLKTVSIKNGNVSVYLVPPDLDYKLENYTKKIEHGEKKEKEKTKEKTAPSFSGSWETADFGTISFIIAENDVVATCTKNLTGMKGKLSSDGTKITGTWAKFPTYSSPNDAGLFSITISSDGKSFTGNWGKGTDSSAKLDKPLNGKKK